MAQSAFTPTSVLPGAGGIIIGKSTATASLGTVSALGSIANNNNALTVVSLTSLACVAQQTGRFLVTVTVHLSANQVGLFQILAFLTNPANNRLNQISYALNTITTIGDTVSFTVSFIIAPPNYQNPLNIGQQVLPNIQVNQIRGTLATITLQGYDISVVEF